MILSVIKTGIQSNAITGGLLQNSNNAIVASIPGRLLDNTGMFIMRGVGFTIGASNPGNTIPDELSLVIQRPNISDNIEAIFSKVFIAGTTSFQFEIKFSTGNGIGSIVNHQDGTIVNKMLNYILNADTFYNIALKHTSVSGLYGLFLSSFYAEYKPFYD